jgi:hypothetical protein
MFPGLKPHLALDRFLLSNDHLTPGQPKDRLPED